VPHLQGGTGTGSQHAIGARSSAPHPQPAEGIKPHLRIVERNNPTPVRRRFSLIQNGPGRATPGGEGPGDGANVWRRESFLCHSALHL